MLSHTVLIAVCAMLGVVMFVSKTLMEGIPIPNVHLVAVLTVTYTVVLRSKALIPVYVYVFLVLFNFGFHLQWWLPNLYIWTVLWAVAMLLPKNMKPPVAAAVYGAVCGLHGLLYGTLWAPAQALLFGYDLKRTLTWIAVGLPYDAIHGVCSRRLGALLVVPLSIALKKALASLS